MDKSEPNFQEIWATLSKKDVANHIKKIKTGRKDSNGKEINLSYLSWAWAWQVLMENYPNATYQFYENADTGVPYVAMPDGSAEVRCRISIGSCVREMWLPVMDYKNNAVENPSARQVSDTKMRCLVKCLAMFGLGHYIYAGEDLPNADEETKTKKVTKKTEPKKAEAKTTDWKVNPTEEGANLFVEGFLEMIKVHDTKENVQSYWVANKEDITFLKKNFEDIHDKLVDDIKTYVESLENKGGKDGQQTTK